MCAKAYSRKNGRKDLIGEQLSKLPKQFKVLRNVFLRLEFHVTHSNSSEKVRSCQIDYVVIGPSGVFLIESKEWDKYAFKELIPYKDTEKADLVVYIKLSNQLTKRIPKFSIVIINPDIPVIHYGYIHQLSVLDLNSFILEKTEQLSKSEIRQITYILKGKV